MRLRLFTFLMMFLATMSGAVWGQSYTSLTNAGVRINDDNIYYYTTNGEEIEGGGITVTDGSPTIYLKDVNIKVGGSAIIINNGANPTFVLVGENTITSNGTDAAIRVDVDGELTIAENSKGILTIDVPNTNDYAIGHDFSNLSGCGTINIKGGTIKTNGTIGYAMYHGIRLENSAILIAHDVTGSPNNISLAHSGIYFGGGNTTGHAVEGTEEFVLSSPIPDGYTIDMNNKIFTVGEGGSINTDQVINASTINAYKVSYDLTGAPNQDGVTVSPESIESIYMGPNTELNNTVTVTNSGDAEYTYLGWNNAGNFVTTTPSNNPSGTQDYQATGVFLLTKYTVNIPTGETLSTNINLVLPNTTSGVTISEKQDGNKLSSYGTKIEDTKLIAGESGTSASVGNNQQVTLQASYGSSQTQDITIIFNVSQGKISLDGAAVTLANSEVVYSGSPISTVNVTSVVTTGNVKVTEYDIKFKQKEDDEKYMTVNPKDVGTYYVYAVAKENSSSYEGTSAPATLKITEKPITTITVDPTSLEWTIGKEEPTFTEVKFSSTDIFEDDKENVTISATAPTGEWNTPGTYTVEYTSFTLSGDRSNNYKIGTDTKVSITLTVSKEGSDEQPIIPGNPDEEGTEIKIDDGDGGWEWKDNTYTRVYDGTTSEIDVDNLIYVRQKGGENEWTAVPASAIEVTSITPTPIKNADTYTVKLSITKTESILYSGVVGDITLVITPRPMNVNFKRLTAEDVNKTEIEIDANRVTFEEQTEGRGLVKGESAAISGTMSIKKEAEDTGDGEKHYSVTCSNLTLENNGTFLADNYEATFFYGEIEIKNPETGFEVTIDDITPGEDVEISDGDEDGNDWKWETDTYVVIYDGNGHGIETVTIKGNTYDVTSVSYTGDKLGEDALPTAAGYYTANVIVTIGEEEKSQTGTFPLYIKERPLGIHFDLDDLPEEYIGTNYAAADYAEYTDINGVGGRLESEAVVLNGYIKIASEPNEMGKYPVTFDGVELGSSETFNPDNYDEHFYLNGKEITLAGGDGTFGDTDPDEGIDIVEDDYISGSGTTTRYQLYLADKDFDKGTIYDEEGLELFSRHNKKYTKAGSSFTIWYEHNGVANDGEYRIFIRKGRSGSWTELKIDTVSDYYQIRNVQTDIYVKIYGLNGYPVANEEISATDARAYAQANKIVVITPEPTDVQIISMAGAVVATDKVTGQREFGNLTAGIYIVRMGETVVKLQVRN